MEVPSYAQRLQIMRDHLLPRVRRLCGADETLVPLDDEVLHVVLQHHKTELGMRGAERTLRNIVAVAMLCKQTQSMSFVGGSEYEENMVFDTRFAQRVIDSENHSCKSPTAGHLFSMYN